MIRLALLLALAACSGPLLAHSPSVAHVDIDGRNPSTVAIDVDLSLRDLALTLPLDADADERITWNELQAQRDTLQSMVAQGIALDTAAGACELTPDALLVRRYDDGAYAVVRLHGNCPSREGWQLRYGLLFAQDPQHRAMVTLRQGKQWLAAVASASSPRVRLGEADRGAFFFGFLRQGITHILEGYDHLAFLLSLLLPAMLVRADGHWRASSSWRASLGQTLAIVTAFTAAHSLTLTLAALNWVSPSSRWVEVAIAASVLLAALNNVRPWVTRRLWAVAFGFGLVHGFGFAGALGEVGLPEQARLAPLAGFNLGVELGQLAVVGALCPLLWVLATRRWYIRVAMPAASLVVAGFAGIWMWQRLP